MDRRLSRVVLAWLLAAGAPGCGRSHGVGEGPAPQRVIGGQAPAGDLARFANITVHIRLTEDEEMPPAPDGADPMTRPFARRVRTTVSVNGRSSAGRVPGLEVQIGGLPVAEVGSSWPQQFSFSRSEDGRAGYLVGVVFRLGDALFPITLAALPIEIDFPREGATVRTRGELSVRWRAGAPPASIVSLNEANPSACGIKLASFTFQDGQARCMLKPGADQNAGCLAALSVEWQEAQLETGAHPFRALRVERFTRRLRRFHLENTR